MTATGNPLTADASIVQTWTTGWALARGTPPPVPEAGGFRVNVGLPDQQTRYVFPSCSEGLRELAESIAEPSIFLKICASPETVQPLLPARWLIQPLSFMMTCSGLMPGVAHTLPAEYTVDLVEDTVVSAVRILAQDGTIAASGRLALVDDFAIYDQIVTHEDHRRRGLGTIVMKALEAVALKQKKTRSVLVATADGRALYQTLGWEIHSPYTSAVIPDATL